MPGINIFCHNHRDEEVAMGKCHFAKISGVAMIWVCLIFASGVTAENLDKYPVRFAILGDRTGGHVPGVYGDHVGEVERMRPDFVMTVGDMIEGYTSDSVILNQEWHEYDSIVSGLSMPVYYTPGNHDITFDEMLEFYRKCFGEPYYSFDRRGLHFIVLDNSRQDVGELIPEEQLQWLVEDLDENRDAAYTLVFFHKPYWFEHVARNRPDSMHAIFKEYGVDAVFSGHFHTYFYGQYDGIKYISVGSSGGGMEPGPTGIGYHFVWVTVDGDGIHVAPILHNGVRAWDEFSAEEDAFYFDNMSRVVTFQEPAKVDSDLNPLNSMITVMLRNPHDKISISDTLRWDIPEGWSIEPESLPVELGPEDSISVNFRIMVGEAIYPAPEARLKFPYAENKFAESSRQLGVVRQAKCANAEKKIQLDGRLDEEIWADPVTTLFAPGGGEMPTDSVEFYFAYDKKNLYLAASCKENKPELMVANVVDRDGAVYGEDCVGYFLYPTGDTVYQVYVNPKGTVFDQAIYPADDGSMKSDPKWDGKYKVRTFRGSDFWSVEIEIPLEQLGTRAEPGTEWGVNFRRKQRRLDTAADWQTPIEYEPETLGRLIFE